MGNISPLNGKHIQIFSTSNYTLKASSIAPIRIRNAMDAVTNPPQAQLGNIIRDTQHFVQSIQHQSPTHRSSVSPLRVCLPDPPSLYTSLIAIGAEHVIAKEMERAYNARTLELRSYYEISITNAFAVFADPPSHHASAKRILDTFANLYLTKVKSWIEDGVAAYKSRRKPGKQVACDDESSTGANSKRAFNTDYVPLLEHFFDENPFPTHADKVFLAKKSGMTYRQIHVWFQNRRNRTKKALHRKPVSEGATVPLDTLIRRMGRFAVPSATRSDAQPCSQKTPVSSSTEALNVLDGVAPPYAFPTTYPPTCGYDPFPAVPTFSTPEWPRRPALSSGRARQSVTDVNELNEKFSRLNVWDDTVSRSRRKAGKLACDGFAARIAITVKPSPAPHPACVLPAAAEKPLPRIAFQSVAATTSSLHVFRPPNPGTPMTTLVPTNNHRRKIAALPNRVPSRRPRGASGSSTSSASPISSSRSSSLESETPTQDWSSNSSSTVTTPETSPSPLAALA